MNARGLLTPGRGYRMIFAVALVVLLAAVFWTQSRYPGLNDKALMSGAIQLEDPLSFEAMIPLTEDMGVIERIGVSTLNWIDTNKKGMTFGILFGAAFLTLLSYLRRRSFNDPFANSFYGLFLGAPLGVCVNCAAPIAKGLYQGGSRAETTLSAMVASPTLNIVVLTMAFALLPFYIAMTKLALSLAVILVAIPLLCRYIPRERLNYAAPAPKAPAPPESLEEVPPAHESWDQAMGRFGFDYLKSLWFIVRVTVPLMLLAGFLGAVMGTLAPLENIASGTFGPLSLIGAAVAGTLLPVPMGFDVVFSGALLNGGVAHGFVMTLVFTLGSTSIYSFMIVAGSIGWRAAFLLSGTIAALGLAAGIGVQFWHDFQTRRALELLTVEAASTEASQTPSGLIRMAQASPSPDGIEITAAPFNASRSLGEGGFTRIEAWQAGIDHGVEFSFNDMWPPFWEGRSIAGGDIDRDGDDDLVFASTEGGLYIYENDGSGDFARVALDLGPVAELPVFNAILADLDNDGWRDLILATYREGLFVLPNGPDGFQTAALRPIANRQDAMLVMAASLADLDRDGFLDLAAGNWAAGWYRRIPGEESRNRIIFNDGGRLSGARYNELDGIPGETLSLLFSDITGDGAPELLVGNDFEVPDYVYINDGAGGLTPVTRADGLIAFSTTTTMSLTSADLTGDARPEIYAAQIAGRASGVSERLNMRPIEQYCDGIGREADKAVCARNMAIKRWYRPGNSLDPSHAPRCNGLDEPYKSECRAMLIKDLAIQNRNRDLCAMIPVAQERVTAFCDIHFKPSRPLTQAEHDAAIPQILARNVLLEPGESAGWRETAEARGLEVGGWSWDVSMADFDNDGDQDVYIVNGTWVPNEVTPSNIYYENTGAGDFVEATGRAGLKDFHMTAAGVVIDLEGDGDLDLVTGPVNAPAAIFVNNAEDTRAVSFELIDETGNRDGVGAQLRLRAGGKVQLREIQLGGGFMSFDPVRAHFGLGEAGEADRLDILWPDGSQSVLDGPFEAGQRYTIRRTARREAMERL